MGSVHNSAAFSIEYYAPECKSVIEVYDELQAFGAKMKNTGGQHGSGSQTGTLFESVLNFVLVTDKEKLVDNKSFRSRCFLRNLVGSVLDWYLEGKGFKSRHLQLNFQLQKGWERF